MQPPTYITPGLGGKSLIVLCVWALGSLAVPFVIDTSPYDPNSWGLRRVWILGTILGLGSGLTWIATAIREPNLRMLARLLLAALLALALAIMRNREYSTDWVRYAINLTGLFVGQSVFFVWARIPGWTAAAGEPAGHPLAARQFRIADLMAITTALACLLGLAIRYEVPIARYTYWTVLILIWCATPVMTGHFALASLSRSLPRGAYHFGLGLAVVAGFAIGITYAERWASNPAVSSNAIALSYAMIHFAIGATVFVLGVAGRFQAKGRRLDSDPSSEPATTV